MRCRIGIGRKDIRAGKCAHLSTESVEIAIDGKYVMRFVKSICVGRRCRKGITKDAPAILNMCASLDLI